MLYKVVIKKFNIFNIYYGKTTFFDGGGGGITIIIWGVGGQEVLFLCEKMSNIGQFSYTIYMYFVSQINIFKALSMARSKRIKFYVN